MYSKQCFIEFNQTLFIQNTIIFFEISQYCIGSGQRKLLLYFSFYHFFRVYFCSLFSVGFYYSFRFCLWSFILHFLFILLQLIVLHTMCRVIYKQCAIIIGFRMYQVICSIVTSEYSYNICEIFFDIVQVIQDFK